MIEDRMPVAADSGAPASDRRQGAARTADPVADHRPGRPASPLAQRGDFDSPPASSPTDRRDADDATFAAEVARLDGLEVADEDTVERVAEALVTESFGAEFLSEQTPEWQNYFRRLARAAIAALKPAPGTDSSGQAVQRVLAVANQWDTRHSGWCCTVDCPEPNHRHHDPTDPVHLSELVGMWGENPPPAREHRTIPCPGTCTCQVGPYIAEVRAAVAGPQHDGQAGQ